jgi:phage-related protein (TIGR01555 family)
MKTKQEPGVRIKLPQRQNGARLDAFMNGLTGLGMATKDKRLAAGLGLPNRMASQELESMYAQDAIAAKIIDILPEDMCREWIEYTAGDDAEGQDAVMQWLRDIGAQENCEWALKTARLHGGAVIIMGINDGQDYEKPLRMRSIKSLNYLNVLDRWQIYPTTHIYRNPTQPNYGKPEYYRLAPARHSEATGTIIHESRIIRFDGVRMPDRYALNNLGWGDPILNRLFDAIRGYHVAHDSVAAILQDFTQGVYKFKGLADMLMSTAGPDEPSGLDNLTTRMNAVELSRSILNAIVMDEDEDFKKLTTNVSGIEKLVETTEMRLVAESDMPHTKLLGKSPEGTLGASGNSEERNWYDHVAAKQKAFLKKPVERLIDIGLNSKLGPTKGVIPKSWQLGFPPLWQQDEKEQASSRNLQAQSDNLYIQNGTLNPVEVRQSRFANSGYTYDTTLDTEISDTLATDPMEGEEEAPDV